MIAELLPHEADAVAGLAADFRAAAWIVTPAVRLGIRLGVQRALDAAEKAGPGLQLVAIQALLGDDVG